MLLAFVVLGLVSSVLKSTKAWFHVKMKLFWRM